MTIVTIIIIGTQSLHARLEPIRETETQSPIVLELFTSQSCSSCPPADKLLTETAKNPNIIALGFHVTYWDHLNWKDSLSREFSTARQRAYASYKKTNRVYTPQIIVNGADEFTGSNSGKLNRAIQNANKTMPITLTKNGNKLNITLPDSTLKTPQTLWLFGIKDHHSQKIPSGENRGRNMNYTNAVLSEKALKTWEGQETSFETEIPEDADINDYVVIAQPNSYGPITAAGEIKF